MLASAVDYLGFWQIPFILIFLVVWLAGGGDLLRLRLRKITQNKRPFGYCVVVSLVAGIAFLFAAAGVFLAISPALSAAGAAAAAKVPILLLGAVIGVVVAFLTIGAMLNISTRQSVPVAIPMLIAVALCAVATVWIVAPTAYRLRRIELSRDFTEGQMRKISKALEAYRRSHMAPPTTLQELVDAKLVSPEEIQGVGTFMEPRPIFYYPARMLGSEPTGQLIACSVPANPDTVGRVIMEDNGNTYLYSEETFQSLLAEEKNADFAKAYRAFEEKQ